MADKIKEIDERKFVEILDKEEKLIIVQFYTNTCPNCAAIAPVYASLSNELHKSAEFTKMNAETNQNLAMKYGVLGVPTFKFFCAGRPVGEIVGSINATILRNTIKDYIKHKTECVGKSTPISWEIDGYG